MTVPDMTICAMQMTVPGRKTGANSKVAWASILKSLSVNSSCTSTSPLPTRGRRIHKDLRVWLGCDPHSTLNECSTINTQAIPKSMTLVSTRSYIWKICFCQHQRKKNVLERNLEMECCGLVHINTMSLLFKKYCSSTLRLQFSLVVISSVDSTKRADSDSELW